MQTEVLGNGKIKLTGKIYEVLNYINKRDMMSNFISPDQVKDIEKIKFVKFHGNKKNNNI